MKKFVCVSFCPELDADSSSHCFCNNIEEFLDRYADGCPVGNKPKWVLADDFCNSIGGEFSDELKTEELDRLIDFYKISLINKKININWFYGGTDSIKKISSKLIVWRLLENQVILEALLKLKETKNGK